MLQISVSRWNGRGGERREGGLRVEHLALALTGLCVDFVLEESVVGADLWVEGTWEELAAHVVLWCVDALLAAVLWLLPWVLWWLWVGRWLGWGGGAGDDWGGAVWWGDHVGLVVAVAGGDDDLEVLALLALVGGQGCVDVGAEEEALECGHGRWVTMVLSVLEPMFGGMRTSYGQ